MLFSNSAQEPGLRVARTSKPPFIIFHRRFRYSVTSVSLPCTRGDSVESIAGPVASASTRYSTVHGTLLPHHLSHRRARPHRRCGCASTVLSATHTATDTRFPPSMDSSSLRRLAMTPAAATHTSQVDHYRTASVSWARSKSREHNLSKATSGRSSLFPPCHLHLEPKEASSRG